ncbi:MULTISPECIES: transcription antitermination factor NusB [unclassified Brevibacterium]|uniref:transcription antitermination factor NusB n=1 Tax=unclassified Brevibacterium TaxID=2614124 RepID=UPI0008A21183|nr:transcription antitermination factor NusB [Brevibacterium sp. Marseille-P9724]OFL64076.1 transcription antitermination factor NusB [Brevibacterium sp. HMSC063G07]OFS27148.1 transcription antitermination factor NusB [Brevibacterium sp. HMSC07C04]
MSARSRARRRALELLFEAGERKLDENELIQLRSGDPEYPMKEYAVEIVRGVVEHRTAIDATLREYSEWNVDQLPKVDIALLRMGLWEVLYNDELDDPVAIDETVSLAAAYSTDDSPAFINALLDRVSKEGKKDRSTPDQAVQQPQPESAQSDEGSAEQD